MTENPTTSKLTIRRLDPSDQTALARLAQLDSRAAPQSPLVGAEVEGRLLAAVSVQTGEVIADPFSRTGELRALLELRASQLRRRDTGQQRVRAPAGPGAPARSAQRLSPLRGRAAPALVLLERSQRQARRL